MNGLKNEGGPAFPAFESVEFYPVSQGMSTHTWLAGLAMRAAISNPKIVTSGGDWREEMDRIAEVSCKQADAMLRELVK